ncbi:helix-turn-helix domain-containing protein [Sphingopyxis indica]|uniref:helix-turn-helix domain-containing protein n=1 Tax=Sphingopyxis indica TaxID=436663 RepID=UPI000B77B931
MTNPRDLLTIDEAAAELNISAPTLRRLRQAGMIGYVRLDGRKIRHTPDDIADYLARQRVVPRPQEAMPCPSPSRKRTRRTGTTTSSGTVVGFMARREQATSETRKRS